MDPNKQTSDKHRLDLQSSSGDMHVHQGSSNFRDTTVTGGNSFQGNFVGLTVSKCFQKAVTIMT